MAIENRFFNSNDDVGVIAQMLCFSLRRTCEVGCDGTMKVYQNYTFFGLVGTGEFRTEDD